MSPSEAHAAAHEHVLRCADLLVLLTMALDGKVSAIGPCEREALSTGAHRALDAARSAKACLAEVPRPRDPL